MSRTVISELMGESGEGALARRLRLCYPHGRAGQA
jgi:hypothetical protein